MKKVSVIITTIGRDTLLRAVKSVLKQTYRDFEIIIVNDNPKYSYPIFPKHKISVLNNLHNLGGTKSLNIGLNAAKGEYIAILDDDDYWSSEDKLEKQVKFLDENLDYISVGTNPQQGQGEEIKINLIGTPFPHSSMMFRKGLRYNEELPRAKDLDLMLRLSKYGKLGVIKGCTIIIGHKVNCIDDLNKKIKDCYWHRKVILLHKEFSNWYLIYIKLWLRQVKLMSYKIKNKLYANNAI